MLASALPLNEHNAKRLPIIARTVRAKGRDLDCCDIMEGWFGSKRTGKRVGSNLAQAILVSTMSKQSQLRSGSQYVVRNELAGTGRRLTSLSYTMDCQAKPSNQTIHQTPKGSSYKYPKLRAWQIGSPFVIPIEHGCMATSIDLSL